MKSRPNLFPNSYLIEPQIKKIISFFGPVRIYHPWLFYAPEFYKDLDLEIVNPPMDLKPKGDLKAILSGYHDWVEQNHDRSFKEILKYSDNVYQDLDATWEIRRLLRGNVQPVPGEEGETLKWHLILHLAAEIEKQHYELANMMNALKKRGPVLAGALDDPVEAKGIFSETDDPALDDLPDNLNVAIMIDAWFGLFSGYLKENDLLITSKRRVMDYISTLWDERIEEDKKLCSYYFSFRLPDLASNSEIMKIRELILKCGEDPDNCMKELPLLTKKIEGAFPLESSNEILKFQLRKFATIHGDRSFEINDPLKHIAGKTIIQMSSIGKV